MRSRTGRRTAWRAFMAIACTLLSLLVGWAAASSGAPHEVQFRPDFGRLPPAGSLQIVSFSFSPATLTAGTQTQGTIQLAGGVLPYHAWLNNSPPGCQPPSAPVVTSNTTTTFNCHPNAPGNYNIHLDVLDSAAPANRASASAPLTVNSIGNGNGNPNGSSKSNSSGSFNFPSGLFSLLTVFVFVFLGAMVALAAGVIAVAVSVSRRLRQLNDTIAAQQKSPPEGKPPS